MLYFFAAAVAVLHAQDSRTLAQRQRAGECLDGYTDQVWKANDRISNFGQRLTADGAIVDRQEAIAQAVLISVRYIKNYKVLQDSMAMDQYILTQCGTTRPTDAELIADGAALPVNYTRKFFTIPLQRAIAASTPQLGFVDILGVQDRLTHHSQYASGACFQEAFRCGSRLESAYGGNATIRAQQINSVDAFFMDCASTYPVNCANVNAQANGVHVATSQDGGNVRGAEYVKFMAAFFNKEREANAAFAQIERNFREASNARPSGQAAPTVAWVSKGSWGATGPHFRLDAEVTYKAEILEAAGAAGVNGTAVSEALVAAGGSPMVVESAQWGKRWKLRVNDYGGSWTNASNWFFTALATQNVDWLIEENYAPNPHVYTMNNFLTAYGNGTVLRSQPFVTNNRVIRIDGTVNMGLGGPIGSDWFESRVAHPDWAVQGLARVLYNDNSMVNRYFRNVATGETPNVVTNTSCSVDIPACRSNVLPTVIAATLDVPQASGVASAAFYYAMLVAIAALLN